MDNKKTHDGMPVTTDKKCHYGCGMIAAYINKSGRFMCSLTSHKCPAVKIKNSNGVKMCGRDYSTTYASLPDDTKDRMKWSKGLTKETSPVLKKHSEKVKKMFEDGVLVSNSLGKHHSEDSKRKISEARTLWLRDPNNRKNLGRHKRSWMELKFEGYLKDNNVVGWETEVHFWNGELCKNYFTDFLFAGKKLIIELDGTQHRKTVEKDKIRDDFFKSIGYTVVRIEVSEFKKRYFSGLGFLDLTGD